MYSYSIVNPGKYYAASNVLGQNNKQIVMLVNSTSCTFIPDNILVNHNGPCSKRLPSGNAYANKVTA